MTDEDLLILGQLLLSQRRAALGTLHAGAPFVSMALYAPTTDLTACYLHLSLLAAHTRDLLAAPAASLLVMAPEIAGSSRNPLTLARISLQGEAHPLPETAPEYAAARAAYLTRFPFTEFNFTLKDFSLFAFRPRAGRWVGGFARAFDVTPEDLHRAAGLAQA